jgi:hypothetical protein
MGISGQITSCKHFLVPELGLSETQAPKPDLSHGGCITAAKMENHLDHLPALTSTYRIYLANRGRKNLCIGTMDRVWKHSVNALRIFWQLCQYVELICGKDANRHQNTIVSVRLNYRVKT